MKMTTPPKSPPYSARTSFSTKDGEILTATAKECMDQLEHARENAAQKRLTRMNEQLCRLVESRAIGDQQLEESPSLSRTDEQQHEKEQIEEVKAAALRHDQGPLKEDNVTLPENDFSVDAASKRLLHAEVGISRPIGKEDGTYRSRAVTAQTNNDPKCNDDRTKSTYRKLFKRSAQCLQEALQVDGVLFTDGFNGYHGVVQPMLEGSESLESETVQWPPRTRYPGEMIGHESSLSDNGIPPPGYPLEQQEHSDKAPIATSRTCTSPEYWRDIQLQRPVEILGMSTRHSELAPESIVLNNATSGLSGLNEGVLQLLMDSYPNGNVWYFHNIADTCYQLRNDTLVEDVSPKDTRCLISTFPGVRQLIFQPLRDPTSLKHLAGCFTWSTSTIPVFTDTTDLPSLRGFLHVVETEISRIDASAAAQQKEVFVSVVSHELRTPLHGILGSVQLLADTNLDTFQTGLADLIKSSGSALNETLTNVLSYTKINQSERQKRKYRQILPSDADWPLPDKMRLASSPGIDFESLYTCTNIALLCEEATRVLQAGQSHNKSADRRDVTLIVKIEYEENWNYLTEPGAIQRVILNIVGNALKYTAEGLVTITLAVSKTGQGETKLNDDSMSRRMITLTVQDTGKGMSKDFMEKRLFLHFTQEDSTSSHGVGLGMSIVKTLVSSLAGEIKVDSKVGRGTHVTVIMPMRLCHFDRKDTVKPALKLEQCIVSLRGERLAVVLFGFPSAIRQALEEYLCGWFNCNLLENTGHIEPDVVLMEEGNNEVAHDVEWMGQRYGRCCVLLSIAMSTDALGKPTRPLKGYSTWERILRPMGPDGLGKALSVCVVKLRQLRELGSSREQDRKTQRENFHDNACQLLRDDEEKAEESTQGSIKERSPATPAVLNTVSSRNMVFAQLENVMHTGTDRSSARELRTPCGSLINGTRSEEPSVNLSNLCILVVDDNAANRRLLGVFLQKYGCRNIRYAENGALAVRMVEGRTKSFDIIFMDISMPIMDGFTATREIRRIENDRHSAKSSSEPIIPARIFALSGSASDREKDEAFTAGIDKFVTKPMQIDDLLKVFK